MRFGSIRAWRSAVWPFLAALVLAGAVSSCRRAATSRLSNGPVRPSSRSDRVEPVAPSGLLIPTEKRAVDEFLQAHPDLRPATDSDRRVPREGDGDVVHLYGIYHPYFVRGDVNDDGILDFVMAFVRRDTKQGQWFSIVVFSGLGGDNGFDKGTFLERDISLVHGDVSIDRDAVLITPDLSDEAVRRYRWDPIHRSYVFVRDDEEDPEAPPLSRT
ncbi:MAG TPA: hypothetical protein VJA66_14005 [Thermoanaerobaculia bacterium]